MPESRNPNSNPHQQHLPRYYAKYESSPRIIYTRAPHPAPPRTIKPSENKRRSNCTINYSESSQSPLPTESSTPSNYSRRPSPRPHCDHTTSGTLQARTEPVITQTRLTGDSANSGDGEDTMEGCRLPVLPKGCHSCRFAIDGGWICCF